MAHSGVSDFRTTVRSVIFQADAPWGRLYDVCHISVILVSVAVTMAASVESLNRAYGTFLHLAEWILTALFTVDYALRLYSVRNRPRYARSFFGLVDLLSILPTYLSVVFPAGRFLSMVRFLRMLRVFRVFDLSGYQAEMQALYSALKASRKRITVFIFFVLVCVAVAGSLMYTLEGPAHGFTSIPLSIYWAIVTLTTVGYGDLSPQTPLGQLLANVIMLMGYSIIVVPTGMVVTAGSFGAGARQCPSCGVRGHQRDAVFCRKCGAALASKNGSAGKKS